MVQNDLRDPNISVVERDIPKLTFSKPVFLAGIYGVLYLTKLLPSYKLYCAIECYQRPYVLRHISSISISVINLCYFKVKYSSFVLSRPCISCWIKLFFIPIAESCMDWLQPALECSSHHNVTNAAFVALCCNTRLRIAIWFAGELEFLVNIIDLMAHVRSRKFAILQPVGANPILVLVHKLLTTEISLVQITVCSLCLRRYVKLWLSERDLIQNSRLYANGTSDGTMLAVSVLRRRLNDIEYANGYAQKCFVVALVIVTRYLPIHITRKYYRHTYRAEHCFMAWP